jgi:hypothetical protein
MSILVIGPIHGIEAGNGHDPTDVIGARGVPGGADDAIRADDAAPWRPMRPVSCNPHGLRGKGSGLPLCGPPPQPV